MAFEQRDNSGVLFKNDRRSKPEHPEYQGSVRVAGVDYWISAWVKDGQKGKFFSLALTNKNQQIRQTPQRQEELEDESDIPF